MVEVGSVFSVYFSIIVQLERLKCSLGTQKRDPVGEVSCHVSLRPYQPYPSLSLHFQDQLRHVEVSSSSTSMEVIRLHCILHGVYKIYQVIDAAASLSKVYTVSESCTASTSSSKWWTGGMEFVSTIMLPTEEKKSAFADRSTSLWPAVLEAVVFETMELACSVEDVCEAVAEEDKHMAVPPELSCEHVRNCQRKGISTMR